jgi:putative tryptophan/tyrosine transport system substrate-binding protein
MRRRDFIEAITVAATWPIAARAQQPTMPVVAFLRTGSADIESRNVAAFRKGLGETGHVEDQNVTVEYHWLASPYDRLPALIADLVRRQVAAIATVGTPLVALAVKAATATIPIVFGEGIDPVQLGLVASLAHPGGNATGIYFFITETTAKRLRLLHDMVPQAVRVAVLVNPVNTDTAKMTVRDAQEAAPAMGLQIQPLNATTIGELDSAFETMRSERADALIVAGDAFFLNRRAQFVTLTARDRIPAAFSQRAYVEAGGLMSYGTDITDSFRQVGVYTGKILKGAKPAELPVLQSTKFEFVINRHTARALGVEVPSGVLSIADEAIE